MTQVLGRGAQTVNDHWIKDLQEGDHHLYWLRNATVSEEVLPSLDGELELKRLMVRIGDEIVYTEEVLSQLLAKARKYATAEAGTAVKDCVITVPYYWSHAQRQSLLDAAALGGFNVLSLLNQNMAIALKFMTDRDFNDAPANVVFYDMGTSDLQVSIYRFDSQKGKGLTKWVNNATLLATSSDESLGGSAFDSAIVDIWVEEMKKKFGHDFVLPPQAITKLQKQAKKTKEILSANKEARASIESLVPDFDFKTSITRDTFEKKTEGLVERSLETLKRALEQAKLSPQEIDFFEMFGGGARIPKIQDALKTFIHPVALSRHLNTDEAAAFGAAIFAASKSSQHRVKEFNAKDGSFAHFPILVRATDEQGKSLVDSDDMGSLSEVEGAELDRVLYKESSRLGSRRTLKIKTDKDIYVEIKYAESAILDVGVSRLISRHKLSLPKDLHSRLNITDTPTAHIRFELTSSGTVQLTSADAQVPVVRQKIVVVKSEKEKKDVNGDDEADSSSKNTDASSNANTAGESSGSADNAAEEQSQEKNENSGSDSSKATEDKDVNGEDSVDGKDKKNAGDAETEDAKADSETPEPEEEEEKKEIRYIHSTTTVKLVQEPLATLGLSSTQMEEARKRLEILEEEEKVRLDTERAKSDLEALIYQIYDKMEESDAQKHSTSEERATLSEKLGVEAAWLEDEGSDTVKAEYVDRKNELSKMWNKIMTRIVETKEIPHAINMCRKSMALARDALITVEETRNVTESDIESAVEAIDRVAKFVDETEAAELARSAVEDPKTLSSEITSRCREFNWRIEFLAKRPKKLKQKPVPVNEAKTEETDTETASETANAAENTNHAAETPEPIDPTTQEAAKEEL